MRHSAILFRAAAILTVALLALPMPAAAQSVRSELEALREQVAQSQRDLQAALERIQELEAKQAQTEEEIAAIPEPRVTPDRSNVRLEVSGRINQGVFFADNGNDSKVFIADNDNSGSRFGLRGEYDWNEWTSGVRLEATFEVNSTDEFSFTDSGPVGTSPADGEDFLDVRHAHWYVNHPSYGEFSIGFSNTATEEVAEFDLHGTSCCVAQSDVDDPAGGLEFSSSTPGFELIPEVDDFFNNLDGERTSRIYYETPDLFVEGLNVQVSARQDDRIRPDASIRYDGEFDSFEVGGGFGYRGEEDADVFVGSVGGKVAGFSLSFAGGVQSEDGGSTNDPRFFYVSGGYETNLLENLVGGDIGETRFVVDYFNGRNNDDFASPAGDLPKAQSFGGGVVQVIKPLGMEAYLGARYYDVQDLYDGDTGDRIADPDGLFVIWSGARVRF
ncbi:MAG: hypothetical protein AAFP17_04580 [Pseudomonadota bacterium]